MFVIKTTNLMSDIELEMCCKKAKNRAYKFTATDAKPGTY